MVWYAGLSWNSAMHKNMGKKRIECNGKSELHAMLFSSEDCLHVHGHWPCWCERVCRYNPYSPESMVFDLI